MKWLRVALPSACLMFPSLAPMLSNAASAAELRPQDFAYGMTVSTSEQAPAYRVSLPLAVYQQSVHEDLGDLRIFNARGESLPYAIRRPDPAVIAAGAARALPLFPLRGDLQTAAANVRITIDSPSLALKVQNPPGASGSKAANSYIVDGRTLDVPLAALRILWPADAPGYSGRLAVEASEDLAAWHTVATAAPITNLHAGEQQLIENRVPLQGAQAKFWRLSFVGPSPTFDLTQVLAEAADRRAEAAWLKLTVAGTVPPAADAQQPRDVRFDLGSRLPVERLDLELPDTNSVAVVELLSRAHPTDPWRSVTRSSFFRLKTVAGEQRNEPVTIHLNQDRYWLARGVPGAAASAAQSTRLQVTWNPSDIEFLAQGPPPFTLAYGNATAHRAETDLSPIPAAVKIARAEFTAPQVLGGPERRLRGPDPFPWQRVLLWVVLSLAVAGLAWMAYRLSKDGKSPRP